MTESERYPHLYMPMEISAREMDSRLLIALYAADAGLNVIMGQKWLLQKNIERLPKGSWIFKTLTPGDAGPMRRARETGHFVTAIDEEIPGLGEGGGGLRWVNEDSLKQCQTLFCLGEAHKELMEEIYPQYASAYTITGNPRWDMLRAEMRGIYGDQATALNGELGRFFLINTNVGLTNSAKGSPEKLIRKLSRDGRIDLSQEKDIQLVEDSYAFNRANFSASISLAKALAKQFPDMKVILRPHPTERLDTYQKAFEGIGNILVRADGPAAPWVCASELLLHTSCTTGTEAFALDIPSISFEALESPFHDHFLSASVSRRTGSEADVLRWAGELVQGQKDIAFRSPAMMQTFQRFFSGQSGPFAAELIARHVAGAANGGPRQIVPWKPLRCFRKWNLRTRFQKRIYPNVRPDVLHQRLKELAQHTGTAVPDVHRIGRALYHLQPVAGA